MNTKLSKREKVMLYFLICFLILTGGLMGFIFPAMEAKSALEEEYNKAQTQYALMSGTTQQAETLNQRSKELEKALAEAMKNFYPEMNAEEIDRAATEVLLKNGVTPLTFNMSELKKDQSVGPYFDLEESFFGTATICDVSFTFYASSQQFSRILQDIEDSPRLQLMGFSYVPGEGGETAPVQDGEEEDAGGTEDEGEAPQQTGDNQYTLVMRLLMEREYTA
ncbi:MAG: type II secretion system protein GspM [Oscillospiraceae bacterium]|nr:type II secretion system protein GspM [Oscillospiraceae bacterium]